MGRGDASFAADDEVLLKVYRLNELNPSEWQDADLGDGPADAARVEDDPLGLLPALKRRVRVCRGQGLAHEEIRSDPEWSSEQRAAVLTTSKLFNSKTFLSTMHPGASFSDLKRGGQNLQESLEQRSEALQILVEQEFDRFSGVKAAMEGVFEEMKVGPLQADADYSTADLTSFIHLATLKADQVFTPLLDNRRKADRLRSTLGVFERSKFFFNLPATLLEAIEAGRHQTVMLSYKRGRNMLDSRPGQILGLPAPANADEAAQHRRIFEKVWSQVERIIHDFRQALEQKLLDPSLPSDETEKIIDLLLELEPTGTPADTFLEVQHRRVLRKLERAAEKGLARCSPASNVPVKDPGDVAETIADQLTTLDLADADWQHRLGDTDEAWDSILDFTKEMAQIVTSELPALWTVAKKHGAGRARKAATPRGEASVSAEMTNSVLRFFIDTMDQLFHLGDKPSPEALQTLPPFAPAASTAFTAAHYFVRILSQLVECANDLAGLDLPTSSTAGLHDLVERARRRFTVALCAYSLKDAKLLHHLEKWRTDPAEPTTTTYLRQICSFQTHFARFALRLAGASEELATNAFSLADIAKIGPIPSKNDALDASCLQLTRNAFLDALYAFLDGLVHVAFTPAPHRRSRTRDTSSPPPMAGSEGSQGQKLDTSDVDIRILLTVNNLAHLKAVLVPRMLEQLSRASRASLVQESETLANVFRELDKILFEDYVKRKASILDRIINSWVLGGSVNWSTAPKPTEVHPAIFDALLSLVVVHASVSSVSPHAASGAPAGSASLVYRALSALIQELANQCLRAFGHVQRFGMGGMLQATLEIEFMHQTLAPFVTPEADATMQEIYKKISTAYERASGSEGSNDLQEELEALKRTLQMSRRSTALTFLCFRLPKADKPDQAKSQTQH